MHKFAGLWLITASILSYLSYKECTQNNLHFYGLCLAIVNSNALHLLHTALVLGVIYFIFQLLVRFTLRELRSDEQSGINDNCLVFLTDVLLIVTLFSNDLCIKNLIVFGVLLCLKCLNWAVIERIKIEQSSRVFVLVFFNVIISLLFLIHSICVVLIKPSIFMFFAYEFALIGLFSIRNLVFGMLQKQEDTENRAIFLFFNDIAFLSFRASAIIIFFVYTSTNFRVPFSLCREAHATIKLLYKKISGLLAYKKISEELNECETVKNAGQCPICYVHIDEGKKIWCGHEFHKECLKKWIESSDACPICRRGLFKNSEEVTFTAGDEVITGIPISMDS
ncbi:hypothetical protein EDEG_01957 [Edhazardia aedis USNM 41457]|uniref:RING-type domain-containing protein n=1 Tax=Edhazardia aedis (strain USNM 41457) TaxID=1003232 RepID=J9DR01_EDHAE|nr:hypothetical protein EDEG_01957 [Edhazardia aedis USNM 41457]|eukprot:EJW03762.1 hypothetical protein EDEG_01957 [Edhazardia aedis USNM 41457]